MKKLKCGLEKKVKDLGKKVEKDRTKNVFEKIELTARFTKLAKKIFKKGNADIKKEVVSIISSNIEIKNKKIAKFTLSEPFCWLMEDVKRKKNQKRKK